MVDAVTKGKALDYCRDVIGLLERLHSETFQVTAPKLFPENPMEYLMKWSTVPNNKYVYDLVSEIDRAVEVDVRVEIESALDKVKWDCQNIEKVF